jgi:histone H3/H4
MGFRRLIGMGDMLVVQSKVREQVKRNKANMASGFVDALSRVVGHKIEQAVRRAKSNKRKTVRADDL